MICEINKLSKKGIFDKYPCGVINLMLKSSFIIFYNRWDHKKNFRPKN